MKSNVFLILAAALVASLLAVGPAVPQSASDTVFITKDGEEPTNAEIAVRLSEITFESTVSRVMLARDNDFADALASGVVQGTAPLLLTGQQSLDPDVRDRLMALAPTEVVLLGGEAALPEAIAEEVRGLGFDVVRHSGPSRFETATAIATAEAPAADTAILVRAFASQNATDPTQAFADSLSGGGLAAENGWPVLLTQTAELTGPTRDYLMNSDVRTVYALGGTAAISAAVTDELTAMGMTVERVAGASRADTAVEIAKVSGAQNADDVARVTLVDGQSPNAWAGGFAAAAHVAMFDAPVVLGTPLGLPPETQSFLSGGAAFAQDPDGIRITCVIDAGVCREARSALGLPPLPEDNPTMPPDDGFGTLVLPGTGCLPLSFAQLSRDGSTVVTLVSDECETGLDAGTLSVVFIDAVTGDVQGLYPADVPGEFNFQLSVSADGALAAVGGVDTSTGVGDTLLIQRDGTTVSVSDETGSPRAALSGRRALAADASGVYVGLTEADGRCTDTCNARYNIASSSVTPLPQCGSTDIFTCDGNLVAAAEVDRYAGVPQLPDLGFELRVSDPATGDTDGAAVPGDWDNCTVNDITGDATAGVVRCTSNDPFGVGVYLVPLTGTATPLPLQDARTITADGTLVAGSSNDTFLSGIYEVATGEFTEIPGFGGNPWLSDTGRGMILAQDGLRVFEVADVLG